LTNPIEFVNRQQKHEEMLKKMAEDVFDDADGDNTSNEQDQMLSFPQQYEIKESMTHASIVICTNHVIRLAISN